MWSGDFICMTAPASEVDWVGEYDFTDEEWEVIKKEDYFDLSDVAFLSWHFIREYKQTEMTKEQAEKKFFIKITK